jgi:hypothetical protein
MNGYFMITGWENQLIQNLCVRARIFFIQSFQDCGTSCYIPLHFVQGYSYLTLSDLKYLFQKYDNYIYTPAPQNNI